MNELIIHDLSKSFGKKQVLHSIHLEIGPGLFGLLGPNGAGKTTFMRILATVLQMDSGNIQMGEMSWKKNPDKVRRRLGYLPQHFGVFKNISALECMDYIASLKGLHNRRERMEEIEKLLEQVNLLAERNKKVGKYSGGMKRRLGIAQALIGNPQILLVDEPTAGLDPEERIRFRNLLRSIASDRIVILSTHIVEDIAATCRSLAVMHKGRATPFKSLHQLAQLAKGQVWQWTVSAEQFNQLDIAGDIISTHIAADNVQVRVLSTKRPHQAAQEVSPTIEEGYLVWNRGI